MKLKALKTRTLIPPKDDLLAALRRSLKRACPPDRQVPERSILVVTSKAVSIWEGRCVPQKSTTREALIKQEAEYYFPKTKLPMTEYQAAIKHGAFIASAGVDKSNSNDYFTLLPKKPMQSAQKIWQWLRRAYNVKRVGVVITDSHLQPLRRGTVGISIGFYGFEPLTDYRGQPDLFGRPLKVTLRNVVDGLAAASVVLMGEGNESTPAVLITDVPFVRFTSKPYRPRGFDALRVPPKLDVFYPLFKRARWKRRRK